MFFLALLIVSCSNPENDLKMAQEANTIEAYRTFFDNYNDNQRIQFIALDELNNQDVLAMIVVENENTGIQSAAFKKITDQSAFVSVVLKSKNKEFVDSAWNKLTDQKTLKQLADTVKAAGIRIIAVSKINDDNFLLKRSKVDISDAVRKLAVERIASFEILTQVATSSYFSELREIAKEKVHQTVYFDDPQLLKKQNELIDKIRAVDIIIERKLAEIKNEPDENRLADLAINSEFDLLCVEAVKNIVHQPPLPRIIIESKDRNIMKYAFTNLKNIAGLKEVAEKATDDAIKLAAELRLKMKTIDEAFSDALNDDRSSKGLGDVLAAISLLPNLEDINKEVTDACLILIKRGDESRIPELVELLLNYGDIALTEDYLNCGQPDLYTAGEQWANNHGYNIGSGYGSNRARWGSGN